MNRNPSSPAARGPAPQLAPALAACVDGVLFSVLAWIARLGFLRRFIDPRLAHIVQALEALSALLAAWSAGDLPAPAAANPAPCTSNCTSPLAAPSRPPRHRRGCPTSSHAAAPSVPIPGVAPSRASPCPASSPPPPGRPGPFPRHSLLRHSLLHRIGMRRPARAPPKIVRFALPPHHAKFITVSKLIAHTFTPPASPPTLRT